MTSSDRASPSQNEAGTGKQIDTGLTQAVSPSVHALAAMNADLIAMRTRYGFDSPIGHACSNLLEQIAILPTYIRPKWATHESQTLPYLIKQQIAGLARLTAA